MYEVHGWHKEAQRDNIERGMYGPVTGFNHNGDRFRGLTFKELLERLQDMFWCDYYTVNDGDFLMLERYEDDNGDKVNTDGSDELWNEFKRGETDLWCARYFFNVEEVVRRSACLDEQEGYFNASEGS